MNPKSSGNFQTRAVTWIWSDWEIEHQAELKERLVTFRRQGIDRVRVVLQNSHYGFNDRAVVRAIARVSQWAKVRDIHFWFHADPRQHSRFYIGPTGETAGFLICGSSPTSAAPHLARVNQGRFSLSFHWKNPGSYPELQERAVLLIPEKVEKVFLFQRKDGAILSTTVRDITPEISSCFDLNARECRIFGNVQVPDEEKWWVCAFPFFSSNLFDYFGRESNDLLSVFIEQLFDGCTHIDGLTWGEGGPLALPGLLPTGISLYNSFKAEYRYDLRDFLYSLILPVDDDRHLAVRAEYYNFLESITLDTRRDFHSMMHCFFPSTRVGYSLGGSKNSEPLLRLSGNLDRWNKAGRADIVFDRIEEDDLPRDFLVRLVLLRSLALLSKEKRALLSLPGGTTDKRLSLWAARLLALNSIGAGETIAGNVILSDLPEDLIAARSIIGSSSLDCDTLLIYPTESLAVAPSTEAIRMSGTLNGLIDWLVRKNIQLDLLSSTALEPTGISEDSLRNRGRVYRRIIYPFPKVVSPEILDLLNRLAEAGFPIFLGGDAPAFTSSGKKIKQGIPPCFKPEEPDSLPAEAVTPLFTVPKGAIGGQIRQQNKTLYLLTPARPGGSYQGELAGSLTVPKTHTLSVYAYIKGQKLQRL